MVLGCDFSLRHYEECLKLAKESGYTFLKFSEHEQAGKHDKAIFLRHDIDMDINSAMRVAKIENNLGIKSTYFLRVLGKYNPWNLPNFDKLKELLATGHELGLHYEPDFSTLNNRNLAEDIAFQIKIIEHFLKIKVQSICPHEPARTGSLHLDDETSKKLGNPLHAYNELFFKKFKYISDSSCRWREGCMHEFIEKGVKQLCILTHPFWWYEKSPIESY